MAEIHEQKNYSIFKIASNLAGACIISGAIIAGTYFITAPNAAKQEVKLKQQAMQQLVTNADNFVMINGKADWYKAEKSGKLIAYVVPGEAKGYGGEITMMIAVSPDGKVIDYSILSSNETPGLGQNAAKDSFRNQFKGKKADKLSVVKDPSNTDNVQALTGATISSVAVTKGVKEAVRNVTDFAGVR